jgi:outer membrane protein assembly factor BamB
MKAVVPVPTVTMRRRALLATAATGGVALAAGCNSASNSCTTPTEVFDRPTDRWTAPGYSPTNSGYAPAGPTGRTAPTERWKHDREQGPGPDLWGHLSTPIVDGESVYVSTTVSKYHHEDDPGYLAAIDATSGERRWTVELPRYASGAPVLADDTLFVGDIGGTLHAVSTTGERRWTRSLGAAVGGPTAYGNVVHVLDDSGTIHGFTLEGDRCWREDRSGPLEGLLGSPSETADAAPAVDDSGVYATILSGDRWDWTATVVAFDHDGSERWTYTFPSRERTNAPAVVDGTVLVTAGDQLHAIDANTGERRWQFTFGYDHAGPPATDGDSVYVGAKNFYAIDLEDGTERWRLVNRGIESSLGWSRALPFIARPVVTDEAIYLRAGAYDPVDGTRLWGDLAQASVVNAERLATDQYSRHPIAHPATTEDALYLTHQHHGVMKFA